MADFNAEVQVKVRRLILRELESLINTIEKARTHCNNVERSLAFPQSVEDALTEAKAQVGVAIEHVSE